MVVGRGSTRAAAEAELAGAERRSPRAHEGSPEQVTVQDATELATDVDAPFICLFRSRGWTDAPLFQLKKSSRKGAELTGEATANLLIEHAIVSANSTRGDGAVKQLRNKWYKTGQVEAKDRRGPRRCLV